MVRFAVTADLHGRLPRQLPDCDAIIIAGDVCPDNAYTLRDDSLCGSLQLNWMLAEFNPWKQHVAGIRPVILTWGNHDFVMSTKHKAFYDDVVEALEQGGIYVRVDKLVTVNGVRIWCSPWIPPMPRWAFTAPETDIDSKMPDDAPDILVTHCPAYGLFDIVPCVGHVGSKAIAAALDSLKPEWHVCGHIHEGRCFTPGRANVSYLDERYRPYDKPIDVISVAAKEQAA